VIDFKHCNDASMMPTFIGGNTQAGRAGNTVIFGRRSARLASVDLKLRVRGDIDDLALTDLHAHAFGNEPGPAQPWSDRLERHSVSWITAFDDSVMIGFAHACWDGGSHAFLLDTVVHPAYQRRGIGQMLVAALIRQVAAAGCEWLHVDYESHLDGFYKSCGFRATAAGVLALGP
jgi:GNAT superfamily N-acetyltransferase